MLKEYLLEKRLGQAAWSGSMPGVQVCRFALPGMSGEKMHTVPLRGLPLHFEAFFCLGGRLTAEISDRGTSSVDARGVFLLSDISGLRALQISGDLRGILVAVDAGAARESLSSLCAAMGLKLDTGVVRQKMEARRGCAALADIPWTQALFEELGRLSAEDGGRYCVFKSVELLYLFCASDPAVQTGTGLPPAAYRSHTISQVRAYLEAHLEEKLTIDELCRRFSLSPTSLKAGFRRMYGQSIHRWLTMRRMKRSRELIRASDLSILEIAQAVGYSSVGQFTAVFKKHCGMTPGRYRKMSDAGDPRLF